MVMPNVFVVGFERSGTTSVHYSLAQHPEVLVSARKESNFWLFDERGNPPATMPPVQVDLLQKRWGRTRHAYERLFDGIGPQHRAIVDVSPGYVRFPRDVAPRLAAEVPDARIVVIIRHPLDHARSLLAVWLGGRQPAPIELREALRGNLLSPYGGPGLTDHGRYADNLRPFFDHFPREQIKILQFDRMMDDLLDDLQRHIGVTVLPLQVRHDNASGVPRIQLSWMHRLKMALKSSLPHPILRRALPIAHRLRSANLRSGYEAMAPEILVAWTQHFYGEAIRDLERLAGMDLSAWREVPVTRTKERVVECVGDAVRRAG